MSIILEDTTESLVVTLGGANSHDFIATIERYSGGERAGDAVETSEEVNVAVTTANTSVVAAPVSGQRKRIKRLSVRNTTANSTTVALSKRVNTTNYAIGPTVTLADGQSVIWDESGKPTVYNKTGEAKAAA